MHRINQTHDFASFYRVEICANLFEEFSVVREWGRVGRHGRQIIQLFPDLVSASSAADKVRETAMKRGYQRI
ncbi:WGR domain-containing protein [Paramylibacter ulvae]|uniref:WGR domain-containing protein n=1 Tax=Paramylibacter ulvae TaxID=1651968 RepID=UPI001E4FDDE4|nr:WGR domain-containing protein [Amylibacter ulvae]